MVAPNSFPVTIALSRRSFTGPNQEWLPNNVAWWFIARNRADTRMSIAFASGRSVEGSVLCANGRPMRPTATASGAQASEENEPIVTSTVVPAGPGRVRVTLRARDVGSGMAGLWWVRNRSPLTHADVYRGPVTVTRGVPVDYWAMDRAGNESSGEVKTR
jgi:hypothetical protein